MARRMIESKIRTSQTFQRLTYRQRDLWQGLIVVADDQGRLPGNCANVRSLVWPGDDIALSEVEADLAVLERMGNIIRYEVDDCQYLQLANWQKYQSAAEWLARSEYPAPPGWLDRARYHGKGGVLCTLNWGDVTDNVVHEQVSTLKQGRKQGKAVGKPLSCRDDDVNDDVNVNDDDKDDDDVETRNDDLNSFEQAWVEETRLPITYGGAQSWTNALQKLHQMNATADDFRRAIREQLGRGYTFRGPDSFMNAVGIVIAKKGKGRKETYTDADGNVIEVQE